RDGACAGRISGPRLFPGMKKPGSLGCRVVGEGAARERDRGTPGTPSPGSPGAVLLARLAGGGLGGGLDGLAGLGGGGLDLALGDLRDGLVGGHGLADDLLAGADRPLDALARDLHALRPRGLQAVEVAHLGQLAPEGERGTGVLLEGRQLQADGLPGTGQGQAVDLGGGVGELAGGGGELLVDVRVHGGLLRMSGRDCRLVRCSINQPMLRCNNRPSGPSGGVRGVAPPLLALSRCRGSGSPRYRSRAPPPPTVPAGPASGAPRSRRRGARWSGSPAPAPRSGNGGPAARTAAGRRP